MSSLNVSQETDDGCWEDMVHADCARLFFNESHHVTKERFFLVCCRTWMEDIFSSRADDTNKVSYEILWKILNQIYLSSRSTEDSPSVIRWILPDLPHRTFTDPNPSENQDVGADEKYKARLMEFWRALFKACEDGSSLSSQNYGNDSKNKRSTKRRRLGADRFASAGFKNLLKGRYKLPAIYLMISLMKATGIATHWSDLCEFAHELTAVFKTFAGNDILAGLALVGLADICAGKLLKGVSASKLIATYFSGIDSYGPSIFCILHDATALDLYNLRASICRQVLDHLEVSYDEWSEDCKSDIISACAVCIDQEHAERFIDDLERKQQQLHGKRRSRTNTPVTNHSIPELFASPGFPLLVHIQICLLKHQVERASELSRKMGFSSCLDDRVKDDAWFNIWSYLLAEGRLFLDGNIDTPGYLKKRDFLYNYMACQVTQKAKIAMIDFYQEVANRVCENEDSSLEEKQYVILACQQTVLRLLLKIRGLSSNTILEFVQETKWPLEIPGQKSARDLNVWSTNFLLQKREVPPSLIDETTGLVDILKRIELAPEKSCRPDEIDTTVIPTNRKTQAVPIDSLAAENDFHARESELATDYNRSEPSNLLEDSGVQRQTVVGTNPSSVPNAHHEDIEAYENSEIDEEEDDEVVILDDDENQSEALVVESEDSEVLEIEDDDDGEEQAFELNNHLSDEDDKFRYSDDEEDVTYGVKGTVFLDEENEGTDVGYENYQDEEEPETLNLGEGESNSVQAKHFGSDDDHDDKHSESEHYASEDDENNTIEEIEDSDGLEVNDEDIEHPDSDRANSSNNVGSFVGLFRRGNSSTSQGVNESTVESDASPESNIEQNNENISIMKSGEEYDDKGKAHFSPSFETAKNDNGNHKALANNYDATSPEHIRLQKARNVRTGDAAVGGEFGDTTEEEDGNDRFRANRTAQADRRADALRSGVGYASQVEDGYEPEDTHGYTEEEVSEAIHTEDEEDDHILKQKPPLSDTDTSQQQAGHASHSEKEDVARLLSRQSRDAVGNTGRQNSIEPTSDDMDMADERTEQEEDVTAEFSELEENPECSLDSQKPSSESTQAKTLLEFAQKAQNKDNWVGHLKDTESISDNVDLKRNNALGQTSAQATELNKICTLSFDADDEKYATEGCKSLETEEEEEDTQNDIHDVNVLHEAVPRSNDNNFNGENNDKRNELKTEHDGKDVEDNVAIGDEDKQDFCIKDTSDTRDNGEGNTIKFSPNNEATDIEAQVNKRPDKPEVNIQQNSSTGAKSGKDALPGENCFNNHDSEHTFDGRTIPGEDGDRNSPEMASGEDGETEVDVFQEDKKSFANSVTKAPLVESNTVESVEEANFRTNEGLLVTDKVSTEEKPTLSFDKPSPPIANPQQEIHDDSTHGVATEEKSKTDDEIIINETMLTSKDEIETAADACPLNKNDPKTSTIVLHNKPEGALAEDTEELVQNDSIDHIANDTSDTKKAKLIHPKEIASEDDAGVGIGIEQTEVTTMEIENVNQCDGSKEKAVNQAHIEVNEALHTNKPMEDTALPHLHSHKEEVPEINDSAADDPPDIPLFIGGNVKQQLSKSTLTSSQNKTKQDQTDDDGGSIGEESVGSENGGSTISDIFEPLLTEGCKNDEDKASAPPVIKVRRALDGLPPRPPKKSKIESMGRTTRSRKKNNNELSAQTVTSARSTRSATRSKKQKERSNDDNDDMSVQTITSARSTRSATRKRSSSARASNQNVKEASNDDNDDDASVKTITSTRSTRSATRKRSSSARASNQNVKEAPNDDNDDDASVKTITSTRSTRSATRKRASSARASNQNLKEALNDDNDDDTSVQTITSTRSTRSATRKQSSGARASKQNVKEAGNDDNDNDASVQTITSTRSTRSATRKQSSGARASKQNLKEAPNDDNDDDASVQTITSTRSTRSASRASSSHNLENKEEEETAVNIDPYSDWTVKMLQRELKKRKIAFRAKARKMDLKRKLVSADEKQKKSI